MAEKDENELPTKISERIPSSKSNCAWHSWVLPRILVSSDPDISANVNLLSMAIRQVPACLLASLVIFFIVHWLNSWSRASTSSRISCPTSASARGRRGGSWRMASEEEGRHLDAEGEAALEGDRHYGCHGAHVCDGAAGAPGSACAGRPS